MSIYLVGDIHGDFVKLGDILEELPKGSTVIQVGDACFGFAPLLNDRLVITSLDGIAQERDQQLFIIRGNHDHPAYFDDNEFIKSVMSYEPTNLQLVSDYSVLDIEGKKVAFIGGGISVDRKHRIKEYGDKGYWKDEEVVRLSDSELKSFTDKAEGCDLLVTHTARASALPHVDNNSFVKFLAGKYSDHTLVQDCTDEREYLEKVASAVNPKAYVYGHFHAVLLSTLGDVVHRGLCIKEVYLLP